MTEPNTPLMRQYHAVKKQHPQALLLFRLGDFYELFYDDAIVASRILQITLTSRNKEKGQAVPMCGVPYHAAENYITRLIRAGHKVAICEQMEQPSPGKKLVRREVIRVLTPGTATGASLIELKENNFLVAIARGVSRAKTRAARAQVGGSENAELAAAGTWEANDTNPVIGLAYLDLSTGEFRATEFCGEKAEARLRDEIEILQPREILTPRPTTLFGVAEAVHHDAAVVTATETRLDDWVFDPPYGTRLIEQQFHVAGLAGFGLDGHAQAVAAAGAIVHYLRETSSIGVNSDGQPDSAVGGSGLEHLDRIAYYEQQDAMILDPVTARNLELVEPATGDDASATVLRAIDDTATGMGARLLRAWMLRPEISLSEIETRLTAVAQLKAATVAREEIHKYLQSILDLERLTSRVTLALATPRDLLALRSSLEQVPVIRAFLNSAAGAAETNQVEAANNEAGGPATENNATRSRLSELRTRVDEMTDVCELIARGIADDPPALIGDPGA
ncbi:MAG: hypothetical protein ACRD8A_05175, partial [Candidatus Acidiferrales bacterium]